MSGKHRKNPLFLSLRTTGGLVAGAALVGTVAATAAHASVADPSAARPQAASMRLADAAMAQNTVPLAKKNAPREAAAVRPQANGSAAKGAQKPATAPAARRLPTAAQAIKTATSQVGISEDGAGKTKFQQWYMGTDRAKQTLARDGGSLGEYAAAEWCDMFVSWVGQQIGFSDQFGADAWTVAHAKWFQQQDRWGTTPKPGAVVFFSWGGGKSVEDIQHVGMVIKDNGNGTIKTVEGNTGGGAVEIKTRPTATVVGYGYPDYAK
ncbi:CHAP domain-containing protein [Actinomadura gamaensis]|uniref:CHAP domain-containing protein n=1 Tax=Actinomadura gamaensis TaxID=1763541 RepID=A0ABV9TRV1_9ACTN